MRRKQIPRLSFHHWAAATLGKLTGRFFMIPNMNSLGNSHEDYMFGILHAQLLGRKLFVIYPDRRLLRWYQGILVPDFLYFQTDVVSPRYKSVTFTLVGYGAAVYFVVTRFVARSLSKITGCAVNDQNIHPTLGQNAIWRPSEKKKFFMG